MSCAKTDRDAVSMVGPRKHC